MNKRYSGVDLGFYRELIGTKLFYSTIKLDPIFLVAHSKSMKIHSWEKITEFLFLHTNIFSDNSFFDI